MKQLKKFWVSLVLLFTVDANAISIDLIPNSNQLNVGEQLQIAVNIHGLDTGTAPSLGVYDLDVHFDANVFSFSAIHWGDASKGNQLDLNGFGSLQSITATHGLLNLFELSFDDSDSLNLLQAGYFTLFTLFFDAVDTGNGNFWLGLNDLGDADGQALVVDTVSNATVRVTHASVPEPSSGLLLLGIIAMAALRLRMSHAHPGI